MADEQLIIGMPAGSLADPNRGGNMVNLLQDAGFPTKGYDKGGPTSFPLTSFLVGWDGRPQEFGSQLAIGEIDIAIAGDDWIRERILEAHYEFGQEIELRRVLSLERGSVRLVVIAPPDSGDRPWKDWFTALLREKPLVTMVAEMPYLALEWFQTQIQELGFADSHSEFSVQKFQTPPRIERGIVIYETWGKTEAKVTHGAVDFGLEITQSGGAIRNYGLRILTDVVESETGIYVSPALRENAAKYDLARMFLLNLYGAIYAEDKVMLLFNTEKKNSGAIRQYLEKNRLFADEPTINEGENFTEFNVQMNASSKELPLAKARYELAKLGATNIETVPLDSSIPGLHVLDF
ncbi:MAG: hypothetical protein ACLFU6_11570 [Candidatus Hydrogenedentota bacterium]